MSFGQPGNELPIGCGKLLLLMSGAGSEFDHLLQRLELLARARTHELELNAKLMTGGMLGILHGLAEHAQRGAGGIEMRRARGEKPVFELFDHLLFLGGLLDFSKAVEVCVAAEFGGQRAFGAKEEEG